MDAVCFVAVVYYVVYGWDSAKSLTTKANMVSYTSELYLDIC